jgi:hypothetical protein
MTKAIADDDIAVWDKGVPQRGPGVSWSASKRIASNHVSFMTTKIVAEKELLIRAATGDDLAVQQLLFPHIAHLSRIVPDKFPRLDLGMVSVDVHVR